MDVVKRPGKCFSMSVTSLIWLAFGSLILIVTTFQSVSPSSIKPMIPRTFTCITSPRVANREPISMTSMGSLSPLDLVDGSMWPGYSHVCGNAP